jgi:hypothetical protein
MSTDDSSRPREPAPARTAEPRTGTPTAAEPEPTPAETRFGKCRWSVQEDEQEYCSNPDVLPYAGKSGFNPEAWCLDCTLYKLRRKAQKRRPVDDDYPY